MVKRLAYMATFLVTVCGAASAQAGLEGNWVNVDSHTRSLAAINIHGRTMHPYGACGGDLCDWGSFRSKAGGNAAETSSIHAKMITSFSQNEMFVTLEQDGRLLVKVATHFTDGSGRQDYTSTDYFRRSQEKDPREALAR